MLFVYSHREKAMLYQFIVNQQGKVYQKNLGPNTTKIAREMNLFFTITCGQPEFKFAPIDFPLSGGYFFHKWVFKSYTFYPPFVRERIVLISRK